MSKDKNKKLNMEILFNSGSSYMKGGDQMDLRELANIDVKNTKKELLPWIQMFNCGYRVTNDSLEWKYWNGCVAIDIDSKHYYEEVRKFNSDNLLKNIYDFLYFNYYTNFYCIQKSNSGTGYHIFFYFNVEKNEGNYKKCAFWALKTIEEAFISIGAKDIIYYKKVIDKCTVSPVQGIYVTKHEFLFGDVDSQWFGNFEELDTVEIEEKIVNSPKYINDDDSINFEINGERKTVKTKTYYGHRTRMAIYISLVSVLKDKKLVDEAFNDIANEQFNDGNGHNIKFFLSEPKRNKWFEDYEKYKNHFVRPWLLRNVGYNVVEKFIPERYSPYVPDKTYSINSDQYISDIKIDFKKDKINHLFAGCGFGKTHWAKKLGKTKRVCFISPLTSINKDSFDEEDKWLIFDEVHKDIVSHIYNGNAKAALESNWNICTTWESFVLYEMYKYDFDYVIMDESHTLYMYDYRVNSINMIKELFPKSHGIKVMMSGTPSNEINEFDCYKIQICKEQPKTKAEIVFFNSSYKGWLYNDIKEWIKDKNNVALVFKDSTNFNDEDKMKVEGINVDVFNKNYEENVNYILDNNNVKSQVTLFSVYGQAGINLYIDIDKKARIYILNNNALGIIQYSNRVRNKNVIDKIVVPFKKDKIDNEIHKLDNFIDIYDAFRKVYILNMTIKDFNIFSTKYKTILPLRYGFTFDCLDKMNEKFVLNEKNYTVYRTIKNVNEYESQIQIIYNRLLENDFDVQYNYLVEDVKTNKSTRMRSNQFAGNIVKFDFSQIKKDKSGNIYIKPNENLLKVCTGDTIEILANIFNYYKRNGYDIETEFNSQVHKIVEMKKSISKKDLDNLWLFYKLKENWSKYYNNAFILAMQDESWDDCKLSSAYMRSIYNKDMTENDLKSLSDEVYSKIKQLRKIWKLYLSNEDIDALSNGSDKLEIENDIITQKIYTYLVSAHANKKKGKEIVIDGIKYNSVKEAAEALHTSRAQIYRLVH